MKTGTANFGLLSEEYLGVRAGVWVIFDFKIVPVKPIFHFMNYNPERYPQII